MPPPKIPRCFHPWLLALPFSLALASHWDHRDAPRSQARAQRGRMEGHPVAHATHTCFNFFYGLCFTLRWMCFSKTTIYWNLGLYGFQVQLSPDCEFLLLEDDGVV